MSDLLYARWVKQRAADVDTNGRTAVWDMCTLNPWEMTASVPFIPDILGKYNNREGIVIDTRFNGGGRLHEDIEILFSGKKYFTQVVRGREACDMPSRRWNKPSIMVQCEANYSNAHGTPWVYKPSKIDKLVGMPVPGTADQRILGNIAGSDTYSAFLLSAIACRMEIIWKIHN